MCLASIWTELAALGSPSLVCGGSGIRTHETASAAHWFWRPALSSAQPSLLHSIEPPSDPHEAIADTSDFYLQLIPEFEQSPTDELHLVLLLKDILKTLRA